MNELVYTLTSNLNGTNPGTFKSAAAHILPLVFLSFGVATGSSYVLRDKPETLSHVRKVTSIAAVLVIVGTAGYFSHRVALFEYIKNQSTESTFVEDHYVEPSFVEITFPDERRNLIFLFVESLEMSYADASHGGAKPVNVIPELTELALENETFSGEEGVLNGGYALYGATYTMGGLFAQTTGLPLTVPAERVSTREGFLPGITGLGEILQDNGYHNYFLLGTDAAFGDRDKYFINHGDFTIWDYGYSLRAGEIPSDYSREWWGYDDSILFEIAKAHLQELAAKGEPFNLTMLTVDTHAEDGYLCSLCGDEFGDDKYSNTFACASRQAYEFVRWCQEQDFYENTTIVIVGDHCTMDHDYADDMDMSVDRRIYTTYINAAAERESTGSRTYSSMDNFPTVIAALGATIEGDRLGLGTNLFSDTPTYAEVFGVGEFETDISVGNAFLESKLGDMVSREVEVSYNEETACIDIEILGGIEEDWDYDYIHAYVTRDDREGRTDRRLTEVNGVLRTSLPLEEFNNDPGTYTVSVYLIMKDRLEKWFYTEEVVVEDTTTEGTMAEDSAAEETKAEKAATEGAAAS